MEEEEESNCPGNGDEGVSIFFDSNNDLKQKRNEHRKEEDSNQGREETAVDKIDQQEDKGKNKRVPTVIIGELAGDKRDGIELQSKDKEATTCMMGTHNAETGPSEVLIKDKGKR